MKQQATPCDPVDLEHSTGIAKSFKVRFVVALAISFITIFAVTVNIVLRPGVAKAAVAPTIYSHSWYIHNDSSLTMEDIGISDASFDNTNCSQSLVVLDFGQVTADNSSDTYGTYLFGYPYPFTSDAQILTAAEWYATGWYGNTNSCPRLTLAIGTSNYHECPYGGYCSPYYNGEAWELLVSQLQTWLANNGESWKVKAEGADDMETEWDYAATTLGTFPNGTVGQGFAFGFYNENWSGPFFYDYGDSTPGYSGPPNNWTTYAIWAASWGIGWDVPLPEIYNSGQVPEWMTIYNYGGGFTFWGTMQECGSWSSGYCTSPWGEYTPQGSYSGWQALQNASGHVASNSTNILTQPGY